MVYRSSVRKLSARARTQIRQAIIYISGSNPETVLYENSVGHAETLCSSLSSAFAHPPPPSWRASSPCNRCGGAAFADVGARIPSSGARRVDNLSIMRRLFVGLGVIRHAGRSRGRILLQNQLFRHLQCLLECCKWGGHAHLPSIYWY